ncbi:unnamed protein product [Prorocentrum cordatum]|uniref:Uncharacterized protein n=1 Tax=Prorocentrum cordatum TaxID=2364126 RepID=A0ABN9YKI3_9DINO|nr:unnamed protein product [Polarella glacialis]
MPGQKHGRSAFSSSWLKAAPPLFCRVRPAIAGFCGACSRHPAGPRRRSGRRSPTDARQMPPLDWTDIVEAAALCPSPSTPARGQTSAALCWSDLVDFEVAVLLHVLSLLLWAPMCQLRTCNKAAAAAFELWTAQPVENVEFSWVRIHERFQKDCLRFLSHHCRNARRLAVWETAHLGERLLLRLVCGMRLLERLEVNASPFGGAFPDPQHLFDRLARYCPRLQHLHITFNHEAPAEHHTLEVGALARLCRRLLTLDLGGVAVRIAGGSRTIAACCPQLEKLSAQLCQERHELDIVDPEELAKGCLQLQELDVAPIEWDDGVLKRLAQHGSQLQSLALRHVVRDASLEFLAPLLETRRCIVRLHLALHARSDLQRASRWLHDAAQLPGLRSLCLDYAAPMQLRQVAEILDQGGRGRGLVSLVMHGCHGVSDQAVSQLIDACPRLEQLRLFPDSWRAPGEVSDAGLDEIAGEPRPLRLRCLSLFAPLGDSACLAVGAWRGVRHLWLGPHKLMQAGAGSDCSITDQGLAFISHACGQLVELTVASQRVTDVGARGVLSRCRELRVLRLGGGGVTDDTLELLRGLAQPRLERLKLWLSGVTPAGLRRAQLLMPWTRFDIEVTDRT